MSGPTAMRSLTRAPQTSSLPGMGVLQRKCKCGSSRTPLADMCDECRSKAPQRKLAIGRSDDPLEFEADRVAREIVDGNAARGVDPKIRPIAQAFNCTGAEIPSSVERAVASAGTPLPSMLRQEMEQRFGFDFSRVRIHVGPDGAQSARDVNAVAYTVGRNIVFGSHEFAPTTRAGRRLLAHELTHVVQQGAAPRLGPSVARMSPAVATATRIVQRDVKAIPPEPVKTRATNEIEWKYYFFSREPAAPTINDVLLEINIASDERRRRLSAGQLAGASVRTLEQMALLQFTEEGRKLYLETIEKEITASPFSRSYTFSVTDAGLNHRWKSSFDPKSYEEHFQAILKEPGERVDVLWEFAGADIDLDDPPPKPAPRKLDRRTRRLIEDVEDRIRKARQSKDPPPDLPDRLVYWHNERNDRWYLNVWVYYDTKGKDKTHHAIPLKPDETADELYERTRKAVHTALDDRRAVEQEHREKEEMPEWALRLKAAVEKALANQEGQDIPNGMSLYREARGARTEGPTLSGGTASGASSEILSRQIMLRIWVQRGGEGERYRIYGSIPIFAETKVEQVVPYLRRLAAVLREGEATPTRTVVRPWESAADVMLPPFDAKIMAYDLRDDRITVQDAQNQFSMFLDFEKQYQSGANNDIYIASKLYSQPLYLRWKVFPVPSDVQEQTAKGSPVVWSEERWAYLYEHYNPGGLSSGGFTFGTVTAGSVSPPSTAPVYDEYGDITTRVKLGGPPGEKLVYCETSYAPIGEAKLKRVSSFAYYPLLTKSREELTHPLVTQTTAAISAAEKDLQALDTLLRREKIDENQKKLLLAAQASTKAHRDVLETKETRGLAEATAAEIREGNDRLKVVKTLKQVLPDILDIAQLNALANVEPTEPSKLLAGQPELLNMYWELIRTGRTASGYERELEEQIKELEKVKERAVEFQEHMKSDDEACIYSPEAVFLSEVTGAIYPLILVVGEARPRILGMQVAYIVSDVTSPQTQREYRGESAESGPEGHIEAIDRAFGEFGDKAVYGTGWIVVRMSRGPRGECLQLHKTYIENYRSKEGILEKVWKALGFIAAVVGVAALVATGVGAPAAAALLGAAAGVLGAAVALHNMSVRAASHTLKFDAETGMDIIAVLGVGELVAAGRLATLSKSVRGFQTVERLHNVLVMYRVTAEVTSAALIPIKLIEDIDKIKALGLSKEEEDALIRQAWEGAIEGGLMFLTSSVGMRAMNRPEGHGPMIDESAAIRQQAELMSLESAGGYKSFQDRGWIDANGNWTEHAPEPIRRKLNEPAGGERTPEHPTPGAKRAEPVHGEPAVGPAKVDPEVQKAAHEAVERVNNGEVVIEGEPGKRHADLKDGHQVVEEPTPGGGVHCEYQSGPKVVVECPINMGGKRSSRTDAEEKAARKKADDKFAEMERRNKERKEREEREAREGKPKPRQEPKEPPPDTRTTAEIKKAKAAELERQKTRVQDRIDERRDRQLRIFTEIEKAEQAGKQPLNQRRRQNLAAKKAELTHEANVEIELRNRDLKTLEDLEITPYDRARAYSYSDDAARTVVKRAGGRDEMSGAAIRNPSIDHIVPVDDIVLMPGYEKLTPDEQRKLLSFEDNLVLMEKGANSSKGNKRWAKWEEGRRIYGDEVWNRMVAREGELRGKLSGQIVDILAARGQRP